MLLSRRTFIQSLLAFAACGAAPSAFAKILEAERASPLSQLLITGSDNSVCVIDLKKGTLVHKLALGFPPHAFIRAPYAPDKVWMVQRYATSSYVQKPKPRSIIFKTVELDLRSGKLTNEIHAKLGNEYRGHGFFAPDGRTLFVTRLDVDNAQSYLTGYDTLSTDSKALSDIALGKTGLHECRLSDDKRTAYVATTGAINIEPYAEKSKYKRFAPGGITLVDLAKGKAGRRIDITDDAYRIGHFRVLGNGHIIATSSTDNGIKKYAAILWGHVDQNTLSKIELPEDDKKISSEKFDIAVHEKQQIAAVNDTILKEIYLIDTQSGKYLEKIPFDAFGVSYDPYSDAFVVNGQKIAMVDQHLAKVTSGPDYSTLQGPFKSGHSLII